MENQVQVFVKEQFKVHGYLDKDGTAWFNTEDVGRSLGIAQVKNGVEYVRFERINQYIEEFDLPQWLLGKIPHTVGKNDFIPENIVYRLAMKANNEIAQKFQAWIADEVVPSIRKTGAYSLDNAMLPANVPLKYHEILEDIVKSAEILEKSFGVKHGIALAHCTNAVEKMHNLELGELKKFLPPAEHEVGYLTPTQIGKKIGKSAQYVNKKLIELGMQIKDSVCGYILTDKGKDYAEQMPFERNGHSGYQLKWLDKILSIFGLKLSPSTQ